MQRRQFLQSLCIASVSLLPACKSMSKVDKSKYYQAASKDNFLMIPKSEVMPNTPFLISHNDDVIGLSEINNNTYSASLLKCTHMGCRVEAHQSSYICPCHGAKFNAQGEVTQGPASKNLHHYPVHSDAQNIYIKIN